MREKRNTLSIFFFTVLFAVCTGWGIAPVAAYHSADYRPPDYSFGLSELLRVVQLYNEGVYHCDPDGEDGYAPGDGDRTCVFHNSDYNPQDWRISLSELLRMIQLYTGDGYHADSGGEDGFAAGKDQETPETARSNRSFVGYGAAFDEALAEIGQISPQEFSERYPANADYLPQISWDVTTAAFWDEFSSEPEDYKYDFRLNPAELEVFKKNGFVVSERMGASSFADIFQRIYVRDLPVFVSADAILHAWHRSYDAMLEEIEESYLADALSEILKGMSDKIPDASDQYGDGVLGESIADADYFLAVARSLLSGGTAATHLSQDERVADTLSAVSEERLQEISLFGRDRKVDFSQFKVRGHYEKSENLKRYFRAMMWLGRIDLRVAGDTQEASPRELGAAIVLHDLLRQSDRFEGWRHFDQMLRTFVGGADSMTFDHLDTILGIAGIQSPSDIENLETLERLQTDIMNSQAGFQEIQSHPYFVSPFGKAELPRSFTFLGQRFALDSWAMSKVVYDNILWDNIEEQRRIPSCIDTAFSVFGNNQIVPEIVARITSGGRVFRDGYNYQHNLAAVRTVVERQDEDIWEENIYMNWLATLRDLSMPTTDPKYPEAMRTRAWSMKTLNTQMASWTQLRHDTILYVKQSATSIWICYYPAGFVEPRPEFWQRLEKMATLTADLIRNTPFPDRQFEIVTAWGTRYRVNIREIQDSQVHFLENFAQKTNLLKGIASKELAQTELDQIEIRFLEDIIEVTGGGCEPLQYSGWYPELFYKERADSDTWDAIVADVHTDFPDILSGDPGCILHQGVGNVHLMMIAVDNGDDRMVYAGPVLSHYEFETQIDTRKSDSEWQEDIRNGNLPPHPEWTESYLVPDKKSDG
ncbi:DUF3160 domain-containing protein [Desulfobacterales bacterium HSG2]|nr:DUF3160 domain-containing protein [Desulfobacterales bacterium HSG2]